MHGMWLQVPEDMEHAHEMEMENQRNIEEDMSRERNSIIQALMKRAGGGVPPLPSCLLGCVSSRTYMNA